MATTAKIIAIGNSAGIILPKETLARLNVQKGDTLYITEGSQGIRLLPLDTEFATQMEAAREVMRENRTSYRDWWSERAGLDQAGRRCEDA